MTDSWWSMFIAAAVTLVLGIDKVYSKSISEMIRFAIDISGE